MLEGVSEIGPADDAAKRIRKGIGSALVVEIIVPLLVSTRR